MVGASTQTVDGLRMEGRRWEAYVNGLRSKRGKRKWSIQVSGLGKQTGREEVRGGK